jgi:hypothetical protein
MVADITGIESAFNLLMYQILICSSRSQIFKLCDILRGFVTIFVVNYKCPKI